MCDQGDPVQWESRQNRRKNEVYEWIEEFNDVKFIILPFLTKKDKILDLGCGTSNVCENLYDLGYYNLVGVDISFSCIYNKTVENFTKRTLIDYQIMDMLATKFTDSYFDVIIDKSTLDAIYQGANPQLKVLQMLREVRRILCNGGYFFSITFGSIGQRIPLIILECFKFKFGQWVNTYDKNTNICFVCQNNKQKEDEDEFIQKYNEVFKILENADSKADLTKLFNVSKEDIENYQLEPNSKIDLN